MKQDKMIEWKKRFSDKLKKMKEINLNIHYISCVIILALKITYPTEFSGLWVVAPLLLGTLQLFIHETMKLGSLLIIDIVNAIILKSDSPTGGKVIPFPQKYPKPTLVGEDNGKDIS